MRAIPSFGPKLTTDLSKRVDAVCLLKRPGHPFSQRGLGPEALTLLLFHIYYFEDLHANRLSLVPALSFLAQLRHPALFLFDLTTQHPQFRIRRRWASSAARRSNSLLRSMIVDLNRFAMISGKESERDYFSSFQLRLIPAPYPPASSVNFPVGMYSTGLPPYVGTLTYPPFGCGGAASR